MTAFQALSVQLNSCFDRTGPYHLGHLLEWVQREVGSTHLFVTGHGEHSFRLKLVVVILIKNPVNKLTFTR